MYKNKDVFLAFLDDIENRVQEYIKTGIDGYISMDYNLTHLGKEVVAETVSHSFDDVLVIKVNTINNYIRNCIINSINEIIGFEVSETITIYGDDFNEDVEQDVTVTATCTSYRIKKRAITLEFSMDIELI